MMDDLRLTNLKTSLCIMPPLISHFKLKSQPSTLSFCLFISELRKDSSSSLHWFVLSQRLEGIYLCSPAQRLRILSDSGGSAAGSLVGSKSVVGMQNFWAGFEQLEMFACILAFLFDQSPSPLKVVFQPPQKVELSLSAVVIAFQGFFQYSLYLFVGPLLWAFSQRDSPILSLDSIVSSLDSHLQHIFSRYQTQSAAHSPNCS